MLGRVAGLGLVMRLIIAGGRIRISAVGSLRSHYERRTESVMRKPKNHSNISYRLVSLTICFLRVAIGVVGRIAGLGLVMRIIIAGIRIRISAVSSLQTQDILKTIYSCGNSWLNSSTLSKGKIHNGGNVQLVPNGEGWAF